MLHPFRLEIADKPDTLLVTFPNGGTARLMVRWRPMPRGTGQDLLYVCPWCRKPRRYLYRLSLVGENLVDYQGLRCQTCAGLRWASQGWYQPRFVSAFFEGLTGGVPVRNWLPRWPWDPRAVSDARLLGPEFGTGQPAA
jgi:hypothetical protein